MKKLFVFLSLLYSSSVYAYYNENIQDKCGILLHNKLYAVFVRNKHTCAYGEYLPANIDGCLPCAYGHTCSGGTFIFNELSDQGITVNSYTCNNGYFLPANKDNCQPCPSGHICSGGTFKFNPTHSQGIVYNLLTQKATDSCAENVGHKIYAVFTPNILTLNWDYKDETGRTAQTTCTYDTTITDLPPTPARPGYKFMGWRVKTSD